MHKIIILLYSNSQQMVVHIMWVVKLFNVQILKLMYLYILNHIFLLCFIKGLHKV